MSLGKLAADYGPFIEASISPRLWPAEGAGAVALDGLVVARPVHRAERI